jgi:hypothetical protein
MGIPLVHVGALPAFSSYAGLRMHLYFTLAQEKDQGDDQSWAHTAQVNHACKFVFCKLQHMHHSKALSGASAVCRPVAAGSLGLHAGAARAGRAGPACTRACADQQSSQDSKPSRESSWKCSSSRTSKALCSQQRNNGRMRRRQGFTSAAVRGVQAAAGAAGTLLTRAQGRSWPALSAACLCAMLDCRHARQNSSSMLPGWQVLQ